jgi:outer membrane protein TolC
MKTMLRSVSILAMVLAAPRAQERTQVPDPAAVRARILAALEKRMVIAEQAETANALDLDWIQNVYQGGMASKLDVERAHLMRLEAKQRTLEVRLEFVRTKARFDKTDPDSAILQVFTQELQVAEEICSHSEHIKELADLDFQAGRTTRHDFAVAKLELAVAQDRALRIRQNMDEVILAQAERLAKDHR